MTVRPTSRISHAAALLAPVISAATFFASGIAALIATGLLSLDLRDSRFPAAAFLARQTPRREARAEPPAVATKGGAERNEQLASDVLKLLKDRCGKCHGGAEPKGGLTLLTFDGVARGDDDGQVLDRSKPESSRLWLAVRDSKMPPDSPLPAAERDLLQRWLNDGTPGLPGDSNSVSKPYWSFRPLLDVPPPYDRSPIVPPPDDSSPKLPPPNSPFASHASSAAPARSAIDSWIDRALTMRGLSRNPEASQPTLLRRLALDLTGLPPSPESLDELDADTGVDALERQVDRLLASPAFSVQWGKQWLDAAGYADSNGYFSADTDRPHAHRYRDYVVRSIGADKPFNRFVREQLAGDELAALAGFRPGEPTTPEVIELLDASHFLRNGQDGTDDSVNEPEALEVDRRAALEATVQVTASSLLGLTVHCARCHEHKFEPIQQEEYYRLQAVFFPAFNPNDWVKPKERVVHAYLPGEKETWESEQRRLTDEIAALRRGFSQWLSDHREPGEVLFRDDFDASDKLATLWNATAPRDNRPGGKITVDGTGPDSARIVDGKLQIVAGPGEGWLSTKTEFDWAPDIVGDWLQVTFDLVDNKVGGGAAERIGYTLAAHDYDDDGPAEGPAVAGGNLLVDGNPSTATSLYLDYPGGDQKIIGAIGQQGYVPGRNYGVRVTRLDGGKLRLEHLVDFLPDGKSLDVNEADLPPGGFAFFFCCNRSYVVDNVLVERSLGAGTGVGTSAGTGRPDIAKLREEVKQKRDEFERELKRLEGQRRPNPGRPIAWVNDRSPKPPAVPFLRRGLYHLKEHSVEPNGLAALTDAGREFTLPTSPAGVEPTTTGRRLAFAEWLIRDDGRPAALMARVQANRIWRQYFGRGIVATTDNLGQSGSPPTHPELLDHLAASWIRHGWSGKRLHREIVTSSVYRQSSAPREDALKVDASNRYLWRWSLKRLPAEAIRDVQLAASGELDLAMGGPYVPTRQTPVGEVIVDEAADGARRRSAYLQQRRSQTLSLLKVFDAPSIATVCTSRPSSAVPLQSLALLNSDFAVRRAMALAQLALATPLPETPKAAAETGADGRASTSAPRASASGAPPGDAIRRAWQRALSRPPSDDELRIAVEFVAEQRLNYSGPNADREALADLCQMLLSSNSFLYLE